MNTFRQLPRPRSPTTSFRGPQGAERIRDIIVDDIRKAQRQGDKANVLTLLHVLLFASRRTRTLPERASPFSRRFEPLSSGEPVRPAMKPPTTRLYALAACRLICLRAAGDSRLTAAEIRDIVAYIINLQRTN
jgi:hypothetical protein